MDIYQRKSGLKLFLLFLAFIITVATLLYTNALAQKIAKQEEQQVRLWAVGIENKAQLVKYTNDLFELLQNDERSEVETWAKAIKLSTTVTESDALTFLGEIVLSSDKIPVILVDEGQNIVDYRNFDFPGIEDSLFFRGHLQDTFTRYAPVEIFIDEGDVQIRNYVYYQDSRIFNQLKQVLNDHVEEFISEVIASASVPVIMVDESGKVVAQGNVELEERNDSLYVQKMIADLATQNDPIEIDLGDQNIKYIYYADSPLLKQLRWYPFIQLGITAIFLFIAYLAFSSSRKAEQNQVWVGMAKETAHQLGTPISSLAAWIEFIKNTPYEERKHHDIMSEVEKDVSRLSTIADRFSKIGSKPVLESVNAKEVLEKIVDYYRKRTSEKVTFTLDIQQDDAQLKINESLFDWVLENLLKNALDAMEGKGQIGIKVFDEGDNSIIEITDTGKGIPKSKFNTIFQPGYSTKKRGWGLGLSLTKRIVENYHFGKIFVKESVPDESTTFKIIIPK